MYLGASADEIGVTSAFENHPQPAVIQVANNAGKTKTSIACTFEGMQGKRLLLEAGQKLPVSTAVSIEYNDAMFLGEVVTCTAASGPLWHLEVKVEQILTGLQSLVALRSRLLGEGVVSPYSLEPATIAR